MAARDNIEAIVATARAFPIFDLLVFIFFHGLRSQTPEALILRVIQACFLDRDVIASVGQFVLPGARRYRLFSEHIRPCRGTDHMSAVMFKLKSNLILNYLILP